MQQSHPLAVNGLNSTATHSEGQRDLVCRCRLSCIDTLLRLRRAAFAFPPAQSLRFSHDKLLNLNVAARGIDTGYGLLGLRRDQRVASCVAAAEQSLPSKR